MTLDSKYIEVSGMPSYEEQKITFPSGTFGIAVDAFLSSINATFGFNKTPHTFQLEYVPARFSYTELPTIDSLVSFTVGDDFYIKGKITHADYSKTINGKVLSITVTDVREDLDDVFLDTFGIFSQQDAPSTNIVDVRYWYLKTADIDREEGRQRLWRDLNMLDEHGATYRQIYDAIKYFEETEGTLNNILSAIPEPEIVESQLPTDANAYRWQFRSQPLLEALTRILSDVAYEFYWDMKNDKINVINRKYAINIGENDIPTATDTTEIINSRYGNDKGEEPTVIRLYGEQMEGMIGLADAGEICVFGYPAGYDLGLPSGVLTLVPGWRNKKIKYLDHTGYLSDYIPTDRELAMSLLGIEQWSKHKGFANRISTNTVTTVDEEGNLKFTTVSQKAPSDSSVGQMPSRRKEEVWVIELYNRIRSFAQNHYGRTYIISPTSVFYNYIDEIDVIESAWCNLENQIDGAEFIDGYKIADRYRYYATLWDGEKNKLRAFAVMPKGTKWGVDGEGTPVGDLMEWTEDTEGRQYVPIEVWQWDYNKNKLPDDEMLSFGLEKGIAIKLPNIAWKVNAKAQNDNELINMQGALAMTQYRYENTYSTYDVPNPYVLPTPPTTINATIPVNVARRYGYSFPIPWASGAGTKTKVIIDESLAPWNYEPRGKKNSWQLMNDEARAILYSNIVNRSTTTFAECSRVGLPTISFDSFANQNITTQGYGIVSHGVTSLTVSKNVSNWWQTKYNIKSHYPQFVRIKPVYDKTEEDFEFVFHRFKKNMDNLGRYVDNLRGYKAPQFVDLETKEGRNTFKGDTGTEHTFQKYVTISAVYNRGANEYYMGIDDSNIEWPRALSVGWGTSTAKAAHCTDGYLQIGMKAVYHFEKKADGTVSHYFTGGVPLSAGRVVELTSIPTLANSIYTASCKTLPTTVHNPGGGTSVVTPFNFYNVPFMFQTAVDTTLAIGDKLMIASHGHKDLVPDADYSTGDYANDAYLVNSSTPANVYIGYVTTKPNVSTGRSGAIQTYDSSGGTIITDGEIVGGYTYYIYFVGCDYAQVELNDHCMLVKFKEQGTNSYRYYAYVNKPTFMGSDSFGG